MRSLEIAALVLGVGMSFDALAATAAEPLPLPAVDYRVRAKAPQGSQIDVAHHEGRLRMDVSNEVLLGTMTGLVDLGQSEVVFIVAVPGMDTIAVRTTLPTGYSFADAAREGTRAGADKVAGEPCDLWQVAVKAGQGPLESCITSDGIVLRSTAVVDGKPTVIFEALELERAAQDPARFALPKGVKVNKLPASMLGLLPGFSR
ncbi:hypothetical protein MWN33_03150 [Starkeya koreensis]|uniref:DUF4412 domain-containing protein n=1 Tax=Ancylobacter koreensis TaxID=266121 RepID=A0ABT0DIJ4_9HYPH|nr:hypothetical protein [Ancylobacter koreensis]MCK0207024.1 hypothetical protein [Ancylobacter koreensis]